MDGQPSASWSWWWWTVCNKLIQVRSDGRFWCLRLCLRGSGEDFTTPRASWCHVPPTHVHTLLDELTTPLFSTNRPHPRRTIYTPSINVHISNYCRFIFRTVACQGTWSFQIFPFRGLALYLYSTSLLSCHGQNRSVSLYHGPGTHAFGLDLDSVHFHPMLLQD